MQILGILGTVHNDEMRKEFNYSLERMGQLIESFNPDIICGEVRPEDWQKYCEDNTYEGYLGPSEYKALIIPLCEKQGIEFIPVDWFEDYMINMDYYQGKSEDEITAFEKEFELIMDKYMKVGKKSTIPFNSFEYNNIVEKKQNFQYSINPDVHNEYWVRRNQMMTERIQHTLENNIGKRILCTVGAEHSYFYYKNLKDRGWKIIYPLK